MPAGGELHLDDIVITGEPEGAVGSLIIKITCAEIDGTMDAFQDVVLRDNIIESLINER